MLNDLPDNYKAKIKALEEKLAEYQYIEREKKIALEALHLIEGIDTVDDLIISIIPWMKKWSGCESFGIRLKDGDDYPYYSTKGLSGEFEKREKYLCHYDYDGELIKDGEGNHLLDCMCDNILKGRFDLSKDYFTADGCFWSNTTSKLFSEISDEDRLSKTRNKCNSFGYESVALIPLKAAGETFGLLQFRDHNEGKFTPGLIAVYKSVADHIAAYLAKLKASEEIKGNEEQFRAVINNSADAIGVSEKGIHTLVNPAYLNIFGYEKHEELKGKSILDLIAVEERNRISSYMKSREVNEVGNRLYHTKGLKKDGTVFDMEVNVARYGPENNRKNIVILRDISHQLKEEKRLVRQRYFLEKAQDIGKIGTWDLDLKKDILIWTEENYRIFGVKKGTRLNFELFISCVHPLDREYVNNEWNAAQYGKPYDIEHRIVTADGEVKWVREKAKLEFNHKGECIRAIGVTQDITSIKQKDKIQSARLRLLETSPSKNLEGLIREILNETESLTDSGIGFYHLISNGENPLRVWSSSAENQYSKDFLEKLFNMINSNILRDCIEKAGPVIQNNTRHKIDGKIRRELVVPVFRRKKLVALIWVANKYNEYTDLDIETARSFADITWESLSLKQSNEALLKSEHLFRTIFEQSPVGIDLVSDKGFPLHVNQALIDLLGYSREEICSNHFRKWTHPDDIEKSLAEVNMILEGKTDKMSIDKRYISKRGDTIWAHTDVVAVRKDNRELDYFVAMVQDITDQIKNQNMLRENESVLKQAQKIAGIGNWQWDLKKDVHYWSEEIYNIYGRNPELPPAVYPDVQKYFTEESWAGLSEAVETAITHGRQYEYDAEVIRPDGEHRWITARGKAVYGDEGEVIILRGTVQDITDRKRSEEALKASEERFKFLSEESVEGIHIHENGVVLDSNHAFAAMLGYKSVDEILGQNIIEKHLSPECLEKTKEIIASGYEGSYEVVGIRCDGSKFPAEVISKNIEYGGKKVRVTATRDITERKSSEKILRWNVKRNELLSEIASSLLESSEIKDLIKYISFKVIGFLNCQVFINYLIDSKTGKMHLNSCRGISEEMMKEIEWIENDSFICGNVAENMLSVVYKKDNGLDEQSSGLLEFFNIKGYCCHPLTFEDNLVGILAFGRVDPFEPEEIEVLQSVVNLIIIAVNRIETEKAKISLETQLRQAQKVEAIGRLAGGIAHDLNNLLSPILGYGEILQDSLGVGNERREFLDEMIKAGLRGRDLVRQLLAFSRKQVMKFEPIDLNKAIKGIEKLLLRTIPEDITLKIVLTPDAYSVNADIGQIEQILMNLTVNAADAMPEGGFLIIETGLISINEDYEELIESIPEGEYAMIAFSDNGSGMDRETLGHLFEPFFSTKGEKGTGLGLATVYGIVKQHNGAIRVYSELGVGTTFKIYLPITGDKPVTKDENIINPVILKGTETILLVEDNEHVRLLGLTILERQGYTVFVAENGKHALEIFEKSNVKFDLLLTDVVMPEMSGKELYHTISRKYGDIKVLYMSGYTNDIIAHRGILEDGVNLVQKPFSVKILSEKVRSVLDS